MSQAKILAIVGMAGSGKSEAVAHLTAHGWAKVYFGGIIYDEMRRRGIEITPESQTTFREQIRIEEGKDFVVKRAIDETKRLISAGQKQVVLDGVYSWTEYKILRKEFESQLVTIAIVAPKALRHDRIAHRPERPFNTAESTQRDWSEIENLEKGGPIAIADYFVDNSGTISDLHTRLDAIMLQ
jgi:dephospho-CoA kinase